MAAKNDKPSPPAPLPEGEGSKLCAPPPPCPPTSPLPPPSPGRRGEGSLKETAWDQDFVTRYSEILVPLAKEGLEQLQSMPATPLLPHAAFQTGMAARLADAEELQKQREGLKRSMEKALELGPKVEKLSGEAVHLLRDRKPAEALPKQQEAFKLLKEIAEPLPKQNPKQDQNQQDQNKQDQNKQKQEAKQARRNSNANRTRKSKSRMSNARTAATAGRVGRSSQVKSGSKNGRTWRMKLQQHLSRPGKVDKDW